MALGGFEQLTLNPARAEGPGRCGFSVAGRKIRRWPAMNGISCAPRAACFTANPRASARIGFISLGRARIGELESFAKIEWLSQDVLTPLRTAGSVPRLREPARTDDEVRVRTTFLDCLRQALCV